MKKRIHLVRHGLSESNVDLKQNLHKPDHMIELDPRGHEQAKEAGRSLLKIINERAEVTNGFSHQHIRFMVSPYMRTQQTYAGLREAFDNAEKAYEYRECLACREQEFGLFNGYSMSEIKDLFPAEYAHYQKHVEVAGEFYAAMPLGESHAAVCDRVRTVFGSIIRGFSGQNAPPVTDIVIVGHGVSNRCFIKEFFNRTWTTMEESHNPNNCSITTIEGNVDRGWKETLTFEGFETPPDADHTYQQKREEGHI